MERLESGYMENKNAATISNGKYLLLKKARYPSYYVLDWLVLTVVSSFTLISFPYISLFKAKTLGLLM